MKNKEPVKDASISLASTECLPHTGARPATLKKTRRRGGREDFHALAAGVAVFSFNN